MQPQSNRRPPYSLSRFALASSTSKTRHSESFFTELVRVENKCSSRLESKASLQSLEHRFADVSTTGRAMRFKPACGVHRVTPDVVNEFADADKARNDAADLQPDAQTEAAELAVRLADVFVHRQRHRGHSGEMIRILLDQAAGNHV